MAGARDDLDGPCGAFVHALSIPAFLSRGATILHANATLGRLLGRSPQNIVQLAPSDLAMPEACEAMAAYAAACLASADERPAIELALRTASGESRQVELTGRRVDFGRDPVVLTTCQDLSDIRHVQTSLLNMGQVLNQIVEGTPVATLVIDRERRVTHWNRACEQLTGRQAWDMQGVADKGPVFNDDGRPLLCDRILEGANGESTAWADGAIELEEFFPKLGDGGSWLFATAAPLRNAQGEIVGAIQTFQDVTARRMAEDELLRHRNQLEALVEERSRALESSHRDLAAFMHNASVGIVATAGGCITRHNLKFGEQLLACGDSAVGRPVRDFFRSEAEFEEFSALAQPVLALGQSFHHEMTLCRADGTPLWMQLIAYASDPADAGSSIWWLLQDRTEVRRAQDALQASNRHLKETNRRLEDAQSQLLQSEKMASIGQLAAGVAHEINNPIGFVSSNLNTLSGYASGLLALLADYERAEGGIDLATRAGLAARRSDLDVDYIREDLPALLRESADGLGRVRRIVQDLKDFSRVDHAEWADADLNAGLESTLNVVFNEVKYKAEVRKHYGELPPVHCIAAQLNQVFMNLIVNAAQSIDGRGVITLSTGSSGQWVWVEVADTGCGMSPETQKRIFEPFFTTKPVGKGTGLGLSLSFSIVQRHKGMLKVLSEQGRGSVFRIWLPVDCEAPAPLQAGA